MTSDFNNDKIPAGVFEHYCEHSGCNEWGGFGFSPSRSAPVRWWCWEHYPHKQPGKPA